VIARTHATARRAATRASSKALLFPPGQEQPAIRDGERRSRAEHERVDFEGHGQMHRSAGRICFPGPRIRSIWNRFVSHKFQMSEAGCALLCPDAERQKSALARIQPEPPPPTSIVAWPATPVELPLIEIALTVCVEPAVMVVAVAVPA